MRASHSEVHFGESVAVVGSHPSIGAWDVSKALVLKTNEDIFPSWITTEPLVVETHAKVEYKYVVVGDDGVLRRWETYTGNRKFVATGTDMTVEDDEGHYRQFAAEEDDDDLEDSSDDGCLTSLKAKTPELRKMLLEHKVAQVRELEGTAQMGRNDTVLMVALQLPVKISRGVGGGWVVESAAPTDGRNFAFLPMLQEFRRNRVVRVRCVGWPGVHVDNFREQAEIEQLLEKHDCIPVFPPRHDFERYAQFYNSFLWPVFHDVMLSFQSANPRPFDENGWAAYQYINNIYANAVLANYHESDMIWVHDYHLLMTPTFLARKIHKANIGLYLHIPFPSSDSFKSLPIRKELLSGMLQTDQLGFQFFAYARNFFISVKRIYGHDPTYKAGGFMGLNVDGRYVMIKVMHFVYPFRASQQVVCSNEVTQRAAEVKALFKGKVVFASMDRCDNLSGLVPKFRNFKRFLNTHPEYHGKLVLVQYTFESAASYDDSASLMQSLSDLSDGLLEVDKNGKLKIVAATKDGRDVNDCSIILRTAEADRIDRLALFRAADVLLDTCIKAGLNLMPFEFITAHHDDVDKHSIAIVSEFSGCSRVLLGSIRINPWSTSDFTCACERAVKMAPNERKEMNEANLHYVSECSPTEWFEDFLTDLRRARKKEGIRIESIGFGAKIRQVCMSQNFNKLPNETVLTAYRGAKNRVLFLDNEGTLAADKRNLYRTYGAPQGDVSDLRSHGALPGMEVLECLRTLCQDPRNTVVVLSGRTQDQLEEWFCSVPKIGLAAERGFYYRLPMTGDQWHCMKPNPDYTWRSYAFEIMRQFVKRTQGSFIESKGSALVWQYRDADQHFGGWQAKELSSHLKELLFGFEVDVIDGKGYVEVKLRGINKGVAVTKVLCKVKQTFGDVDFVLCIGDDRSDEDMFEALGMFISPPDESADNTSSQLSTTDGESPERVCSDGDAVQRVPSDRGLPQRRTESFTQRRSSKFGLASFSAQGGPLQGSMSRGELRKLGSGGLSAAGDSESSKVQRFFTCTVGRKPSAAMYYVDDVDEVSELLTSLKSQHDKKRTDVGMPSYHTWSGGDMGKSKRVGSMPALASLAFAPPSARRS